MAHQDDRTPRASDLPHLPQALALEAEVADGQHLVDQEDLGLEMGSHGEGQAHVHAGGVPLDRGVEELGDLGELDDVVELPPDLGPRHAQDGAVQVDVLAAAELLVEAHADLEQAADATVDLRPARGRLGDAREDLEQGALAGAVAADDADHLPCSMSKLTSCKAHMWLTWPVEEPACRRLRNGALAAFVIASRKRA